MTPHIEMSGDVSLNLDMKLSSLAGASLNNIPILANRQYSGVVSLRIGDSTILVSDLSTKFITPFFTADRKAYQRT